MERWRDEVGILPQGRAKNYPSFSSTLLDAIYRSIDEIGDCAATNEHCNGGGRDPFFARKKQCDAYSVHRKTPPMILAEVTRSGREHWGRRNPSPVTRSGREHWNAAAATSSSSDVSSYGGFSSSEAESVTASHPARLRPIRTSSVGSSTFPARFGRHHPSTAPPPPPLVVAGGDEKRGKKEHPHGSIRSRLMRELRKGRAPASPGSRFANFLHSLFPAKSKLSGNSVASGEDSTCSTASSYSRSCLSKTPSSRGRSGSGKRTVSFNPSSVIVNEDCRPCGEKFNGGVNQPTPRESASVKRVSDLLSRSKMEEEQENGESDSSSDLFELENLAVIGRFQDELPVYETTSFSGYCGISHGMLMRQNR